MRLAIVTPLFIAVAEDEVVSITAEDESGSFGIWPKHADFVTVLTISVVGWKCRDGSQRYCAVRGGTLTMTGGDNVTITSREAIPGDDIGNLDQVVIARFVSEDDAEKSERVDLTRMQLAAIRQVVSHLHAPGDKGGWS